MLYVNDKITFGAKKSARVVAKFTINYKIFKSLHLYKHILGRKPGVGVAFQFNLVDPIAMTLTSLVSTVNRTHQTPNLPEHEDIQQVYIISSFFLNLASFSI